jgi:hypothetical protein
MQRLWPRANHKQGWKEGGAGEALVSVRAGKPTTFILISLYTFTWVGHKIKQLHTVATDMPLNPLIYSFLLELTAGCRGGVKREEKPYRAV